MSVHTSYVDVTLRSHFDCNGQMVPTSNMSDCVHCSNRSNRWPGDVVYGSPGHTPHIFGPFHLFRWWSRNNVESADRHTHLKPIRWTNGMLFTIFIAFNLGKNQLKPTSACLP